MRRYLIALAAIGACSAAQASISLTAALSNAAENPPTVPTLVNGQPRPASFGNASLTINDAQTAMTMTMEIFNIDFTGTQTADINDNLLLAHIHGGAAVTPGTNGGVVWGFIGSPFNDTTPTDTIVTPFPAPGVGATIVSKWDAPEGNGTTLALQLGNLTAFPPRTYLNFHTQQFGGGEIRGNIVPEPASAMLAVLGLGALRRRR